jgi:hypothetical protein
MEDQMSNYHIKPDWNWGTLDWDRLTKNEYDQEPLDQPPSHDMDSYEVEEDTKVWGEEKIRYLWVKLTEEGQDDDDSEFDDCDNLEFDDDDDSNDDNDDDSEFDDDDDSELDDDD